MSGHKEQFRIEVAEGGQARVFNIKPLGDTRYEIFVEEQTIWYYCPG